MCYSHVSVQQNGKIGRQNKPKNQEKVSLQQMVSFQSGIQLFHNHHQRIENVETAISEFIKSKMANVFVKLCVNRRL
ncbi:hypothetical protein NHG98_00905 [Wolbachia endosymbiont of Aedes albopictus]|nr:hypothetical protein NHG98_00905 [Wolbachia endosymbiont of Aedes albopictus]